ncbi:PEP-CTERM sorting domain-containing protein [Janthinobacterium sp. ZB1P44]|uniref:cohesin domain-containing protein n=1 Tax=Janthinobacterium sp. ZB1P44 TaxID=3424192 RepID=UPI003F214729
MATRLTSICLQALGALLACSVHASAAPIIDIEPETLFVSHEQSFGVNIVIHDATDLFAFQFDLSFDPRLLSATGVADGGLLSVGGPAIFSPGTIENVAGRISFTLGTLTDNLPGVNGTGALAGIEFRSRNASGIATLKLSDIILLDSNLADIAFAAPLPAPIAVVPEPGTLALLAPMLLGMAWMVRRRPAHLPPQG